METKYNNVGTIVGYDFGDFSVHSHVSDPESWYFTYRSLGIFSQYLCLKGGSVKLLIEMLHNKLGSEISKLKQDIEKLDAARGMLSKEANGIDS